MRSRSPRRSRPRKRRRGARPHWSAQRGSARTRCRGPARLKGFVSPACGNWQGLHSSAGPSRRRGSSLAKPRPALEVDDPPAHRAVFGFDDVLPLETVVAGHAGVTACPANERADDMVTASDRLALQLAVNHVAALVGPDAAALHAGAT